LYYGNSKTLYLIFSLLNLRNKPTLAMENTSQNNAANKLIQIFETQKTIILKHACIDNSDFNDVSAIGLKISNANLSDLEIDGAQLGGAYIHNIDMPPKGHPAYTPDAKQRPLKFENCNLNNSTVANCNLSGVTIENCNISGMKINGLLIDELLKECK
jgi:uncharacterized protein YjbI with pentapeptide repeats